MAVEALTQISDDVVKSEAPKDELTAESGASLFVESFRFTQGSPYYHKKLFTLVHHLRPTWQMSDELREEIMAKASPRIDAFLSHAAPNTKAEFDIRSTEGESFNHGALESPEAIRVQKNDSMNWFQSELNSPPVQDPTELVDELTAGLLFLDHKFVSRGRIRANINPLSPQGNRKFSFICYYGLAEQTTRTPVFDEAFRLVTERIRENKYSTAESLIYYHNQTYAGTSLELPTQI